mmetsp:Transcript_12866/g.26310  ORF Transcript_12866/g.26310 Transcript_12866/m.26310 type:complete len:289 (-) Transcript_12866:1400-2266(-)
MDEARLDDAGRETEVDEGKGVVDLLEDLELVVDVVFERRGTEGVDELSLVKDAAACHRGASATERLDANVLEEHGEDLRDRPRQESRELVLNAGHGVEQGIGPGRRGVEGEARVGVQYDLNRPNPDGEEVKELVGLVVEDPSDEGGRERVGRNGEHDLGTVVGDGTHALDLLHDLFVEQVVLNPDEGIRAEEGLLVLLVLGHNARVLVGDVAHAVLELGLYRLLPGEGDPLDGEDDLGRSFGPAGSTQNPEDAVQAVVASLLDVAQRKGALGKEGLQVRPVAVQRRAD